MGRFQPFRYSGYASPIRDQRIRKTTPLVVGRERASQAWAGLNLTSQLREHLLGACPFCPTERALET